MFEDWEKKYGPVFSVPSVLGTTRVALCDPRAVAHFYSKENSVYVRPEFARILVEKLTGRSIIWAEGESHRRQRKAMTPAFSNIAISNVTKAFYDSAYKAVEEWASTMDDDSGKVIEVQSWMSRISLDTIGVAGFSHDFGTLDGKHSLVAEIFDKFTTTKPSLFFKLSLLIGLVFPWIMKPSFGRSKLTPLLNNALGGVADHLIERTRQEAEGAAGSEKDRSILGLLVKAGSKDTELGMNQEEVLSQIKLLLVAGYETTSISLTWALTELAQNQDCQHKLRAELSRFVGTDPTYEELTSGLPYLNAVVLETLRVHPPFHDTGRIASKDDIIPLSSPLSDASGKLVDHIAVARGTEVVVSIQYMNRSEKFWGPDAKTFNPDRWLEPGGLSAKAREIQGHKHLLTFIDGPRTCLGKAFALAEMKAVLSVLVRNFAFGLREGKVADVELARGILPRPKIVGEKGADVPLRVSRVDSN